MIFVPFDQGVERAVSTVAILDFVPSVIKV